MWNVMVVVLVYLFLFWLEPPLWLMLSIFVLNLVVIYNIHAIFNFLDNLRDNLDRG